MSPLVLGISAYYHDSAAALVDGTTPVAAAQQERFSRRRHDRSFPADAVRCCLREAGVGLDDLDGVAYYEDPALKFRRVLATVLGAVPRGYDPFRAALPQWLAWKRRAADTVHRELADLGLGAPPPVTCLRHHRSHAASAYLPSPYESAAVLCLDGVGEWATTSVWHGRGEQLRPLAEIRFPHSLGLLYSAFTYFCGFTVDSGEYKLMGLAPYGRPRYARLIRERLVDVKPDGSFRLDMRYFAYLHDTVMTGKAFAALFGGGPRRTPEGPLTEREFDLAASVQQVTEDIVVRLARTAAERTGERRLCLAGGVALNCVANGRIAEQGVVDELWVQPAAGDAGGALGSALGLAVRKGARRTHVGRGDAMSGSLLGPSYSDDDIKAHLDENGLVYTWAHRTELLGRVADALAEGKVVGWFQGRMEFGPRALGNRSILGDPRDPDMQRTMNVKIKFRESFRPFAPSVRSEDATRYFRLTQDSPYMLLVAGITAEQALPVDTGGRQGLDLLRVQRSRLPAVTHVDGSARVQTVDEHSHPLYHGLLSAFAERTGCPVLVNTSFNVRGEPIVNTPADAVTCFRRTDIDLLALGGFLLEKADQPAWVDRADWRSAAPTD